MLIIFYVHWSILAGESIPHSVLFPHLVSQAKNIRECMKEKLLCARNLKTTILSAGVYRFYKKILDVNPKF